MRSLLVILPVLAGLSASAAVMAAEWPAATLGPREVWDAATDHTSQTRFIPMQLIVPGAWDGTRRIDLPPAGRHDDEGATWTGPEE